MVWNLNTICSFLCYKSDTHGLNNPPMYIRKVQNFTYINTESPFNKMTSLLSQVVKSVFLQLCGTTRPCLSCLPQCDKISRVCSFTVPEDQRAQDVLTLKEIFLRHVSKESPGNIQLVFLVRWALCMTKLCVLCSLAAKKKITATQLIYLWQWPKVEANRLVWAKVHI